MKRKGLCLMIALALGGSVVAAQAQDTQGNAMPTQGSSMMSTTASANHDRWYVVPTVGVYFNDSDRNTHDRVGYVGLGVGKFISPNTSVEFFADRVDRDRIGRGHWRSNAFGLSARFYWGAWDAWRPFVMAGIADSYHITDGSHGWSPAGQVGAGLSKTVGDDAIFRIGATYRYERDGDTRPSQSGYGDWMLGVSLAAMFGAPPAPPPPPPPPMPPAAPPPPPPPTCDQLDGDHDGVNNCVDKCPNSEAGSFVGPDGCPQAVVIDLRGVNFKFDRPSKGETTIAPTLKEPTADSMALLKQAVDTLKRYPKVTVKVAGYTDSIGTDAYNQGLSDRRAQIVYNYLTSHGISASRLEGPIGHGENDPVATNKTKAGRARNRRVELQVDQAASGVKVKQTNNGMDNGMNDGMNDGTNNGM